MPGRPNVLWLMSDQHNANCAGYAGHPNVRTPSLDRIAGHGITFTNAFANNPICAPSRICFTTGQYPHTHRLLGNDHSVYPHPNPNTLPCLFRRYGYQTALIGKSHTVPLWDREGFEHIRYTDLCDASPEDPTTSHYFKYLVDRGLADLYGEGVQKKGQEYVLDGSEPALLPFEHSVEHFTGEETLKFLDGRDADRPFFVHMSFERPHSPIAPAPEHFNMYDPGDIVLPENASDYFENRFSGKPAFMQKLLRNGCPYPLADPNPARLKRCLASYYALITEMDIEIGRVLDSLAEAGELENTIVLYTADHGDFAGEHGLFHKNLGIYESIHRIPFVLTWPGGPQGRQCNAIVESVDWYPTLCGLCNVPAPKDTEGIDLIPVTNGDRPVKDAAFCEWDWPIGRISAIRTEDFRLVYYQGSAEGELYDRRDDPGETRNLWADAAYAGTRMALVERLLGFTMQYRADSDLAADRILGEKLKHTPRYLVHFGRRYWSELKDAYERGSSWPPVDGRRGTRDPS
ncbi:sulfatase [Verrucomicrobiota bacterium]